MWLSSIAFLGLLAVSAAYVPEVRGPYGSYGNYDNNANLENTLESLEVTINRLEERQQAQELKINDLIDSSSDNQGLQFDFNDVALEDVNNEIAAQNDGFARLEESLARIRGIKTELDNLEYKVAAIRVQVNQTDAKGIAVLAKLNGLVENAFPVDEEITVQATEACRITKGLERAFNQTKDNARQLSALEFRVDQIITTQDSTTAKAYEVELLLKSGVAGTTLDYPGYARDVGIYINGFDIDRSGKRNYYDKDETQNLFFHANADFAKDVEVNVYDISDSGWYLTSIDASVIALRLLEPRLGIRESVGAPE